MYRTMSMTAEWINIQPLVKFVKELANKAALRKQVRDTINELSALSDAELRDIGISRGMIRSIAMEVYYDDLDKGVNNSLRELAQ